MPPSGGWPPSIRQIEAGSPPTATGSPLALAALEALADSRLFYTADKGVFIKAHDGSYIDARTGDRRCRASPSALSPCASTTGFAVPLKPLSARSR